VIRGIPPPRAGNAGALVPVADDLGADEPKGEVSRAYRAYREGDGYSERALFVIDPDGSIFWSYLSPVGVNPGADGILRALEDIANRRAAT
jgi:alkyl hydroperoxide reductase subunit AhpC